MKDFITYLVKANVAIGLFYFVYRNFPAQLTFYKINRYYLVLLIVDGKIMPDNDLGQLNPENIRKISVFKGVNALDHSGKKGKEGVIEILLKGDKP